MKYKIECVNEYILTTTADTLRDEAKLIMEKRFHRSEVVEIVKIHMKPDNKSVQWRIKLAHIEVLHQWNNADIAGHENEPKPFLFEP